MLVFVSLDLDFFLSVSSREALNSSSCRELDDTERDSCVNEDLNWKAPCLESPFPALDFLSRVIEDPEGVRLTGPRIAAGCLSCAVTLLDLWAVFVLLTWDEAWALASLVISLLYAPVCLGSVDSVCLRSVFSLGLTPLTEIVGVTPF